MAQKDWSGGVIRGTPVTPAGPYQNGAAPGVWTLDQVYKRQEIGWATYWDTQNSNWDDGNYSLGGIAVTANGNVYAGATFYISGSYYSAALFGCNATTGSPVYLGTESTFSQAVPSYGQTGVVSVSGNNLAFATFYGDGTTNSAPQFSYVSVSTPGTPSETWGKYTGANNTGQNGNTYGLASDGSSLYVSSNGASGYYTVNKYNSSGTRQWVYGSSSYSRTYFNLGINAAYSTTYGYACEISSSTAYAINQFDLSTGASNWTRTFTSNTGNTYNDPYYTNRCCVASDGGVIFAVGKTLNDYGAFVYLAKVSSDGNTLSWAKQINDGGYPVQVVSAGGFVYVLVRTSGSNAYLHKINETTGACVFRNYFTENSGSNRMFPCGLAVDSANNAIYVAMLTRPTGTYYRTWMWRVPISGVYTGNTVGGVTYNAGSTTYANLGSATVGGSGGLAWSSVSPSDTSNTPGFSSRSVSSSTTTF